MSLLYRLFSFNLRFKFVLPISALLTVAMLMLSSFLIQRQSDSYRRELESSGKTLLTILAINAESGVLFGSSYELNDLLKGLDQFGSVEYGLISNKEGEVIARIGESHLDTDQTEHLRYDLEEVSSVGLEYCKDENDRELLVMVAPIITQKQDLNRESLGITGGVDRSLTTSFASESIGWIEIGFSVQKVKQEIADAKFAAILVTVLVVIVTILLVAFIVNAITKPVTELVEATDRISRGEFDTHVEITQRDEIGHLAETFNRMTESIRESRYEIERYNKTLEEKIIERTRQLEEAQAQLIQSEKMSAIGQLAAGVAHELNNPLGGILGYAQFTLEKLHKNVPDKTSIKEIQSYTRYVSDIETQARRCKTIVQNLLRFSRSSRTVDFEEEVDVNMVLEDTISFVEHQLRISEIELSINLDRELPLIYGNAGQLQQVFTNLIINSMHASEAGSEIQITSRFSPALGEFGGTVELQFKDSGHGIAEENVKRIFEPFFTTKEVGKGTGLGLSVSYGIIKEHGGEISVQSQVNSGTTFTIILPVQKLDPTADNLSDALGIDI